MRERLLFLILQHLGGHRHGERSLWNKCFTLVPLEKRHPLGKRHLSRILRFRSRSFRFEHRSFTKNRTWRLHDRSFRGGTIITKSRIQSRVTNSRRAGSTACAFDLLLRSLQCCHLYRARCFLLGDRTKGTCRRSFRRWLSRRFSLVASTWSLRTSLIVIHKARVAFSATKTLCLLENYFVRDMTMTKFLFIQLSKSIRCFVGHHVSKKVLGFKSFFII